MYFCRLVDYIILVGNYPGGGTQLTRGIGDVP